MFGILPTLSLRGFSPALHIDIQRETLMNKPRVIGQRPNGFMIVPNIFCFGNNSEALGSATHIRESDWGVGAPGLSRLFSGYPLAWSPSLGCRGPRVRTECQRAARNSRPVRSKKGVREGNMVSLTGWAGSIKSHVERSELYAIGPQKKLKSWLLWPGAKRPA